MTEIDLTPITRLEYDIDAILNDHAVAEPITRIELILADIVAGNTTTVEPVTRIETYLAIISGADYPVPEPVTRIETFLAIIAGEDYEKPEAVTRLEGLLAEWVEKGSGIWKTATGSLLHLTDALASPMQKCEVTLEPQQSGSGDPSPTNVRPITGWTGCEVWVKDEYDTSLPATASVTFPDSTGTVYGGTVDLVSGVLTVTGVKAVIDASVSGVEVALRISDAGGVYFSKSLITLLCLLGAGDIGKAKNIEKYSHGTIENPYSNIGNYAWVFSQNATRSTLRIGFADSNIATLQDLANFITENGNIEIYYPLAEPIEIQLTPQEISTLKGENNVWSNGDSVEITYKANA